MAQRVASADAVDWSRGMVEAGGGALACWRRRQEPPVDCGPCRGRALESALRPDDRRGEPALDGCCPGSRPCSRRRGRWPSSGGACATGVGIRHASTNRSVPALLIQELTGRKLFVPRCRVPHCYLQAIFLDVRRDLEATLKEFDGERDHVYLLITYPPKVAISRLVNRLKGVSSRLIRKQRYPSIERALWGGNLWSPSYFAGSAGGASLSIIRQYIEQQETPE